MGSKWDEVQARKAAWKERCEREAQASRQRCGVAGTGMFGDLKAVKRACEEQEQTFQKVRAEIQGQ